MTFYIKTKFPKTEIYVFRDGQALKVCENTNDWGNNGTLCVPHGYRTYEFSIQFTGDNKKDQEAEFE